MDLHVSLQVVPGVTSVAGSGGKTTLLATLARELARGGAATVALATSTRIRPFDGMPLLDGGDLGAVRDALARAGAVCVGTPAEAGKLAAPRCTFEKLATIADYVIVEADGSRGLPLKAHEAWEPVIPAGSQQTILVVGANGLGLPVRAAVHRPERFCALAGCTADDAATPARVARVIGAEGLATRVLITHTAEAASAGAARALAEHLDVPVAFS